MGSLVSSGSSQPLMMSQALMNIQRKTISPQIIKHNQLKHSNNASNDELEVRFIDINDEKENIYECSNVPPQSTKNVYQTPNPYQHLLRSGLNKLAQTQTTAVSSTPG